MQRKYYFILLLIGVALSSCKSEFEKIRASGDPAEMFQKANEYYNTEKYVKAQSLYELIVSSYRGKKEAEEIYYKYAYTYYYTEQYLLAAYYFKNFANTYGASEYREEADFMSAYSNYLMSPVFRLDQSSSVTAIDEFQEFINRYPNSEHVGECNRLIDALRAKLEKKEFEAAKLYYNMKQYEAAIQTFENVLIEFPETSNAMEIRYLVARAAYQLAGNSFVQKQAERFKVAEKKASEFLDRYTDSLHKKEVAQMLSKSRKRLKELKNG